MKISSTHQTLTRVFALLCLTLLALTASGALSQAEEGVVQTEQEEDFFYSAGKRIPVLISLDKVGILVREEVKEGMVREVATSSRLRILQSYPGGLYILALEKRVNRQDLVKLARDLMRRLGPIIGQAGLVVTPVGAESPMVVSDQFIAQFRPEVKREEIERFNRSNGVQIVTPNPFVKNQLLLKVTDASQFDALKMANLYEENANLVVFAHPNFTRVVEPRETIPTDTLFGNQWHHRNTGQSAGTPDADIDTSLAWDLTLGLANTIIATIDGGFDLAHPDLMPNFWVNLGEVAANGIDDDGNGFTDDVNGWDFTGCDTAPGAGCGDNNPTGPDTSFGRHGTAVAGVAAARGNNALGVSGSCPNCGLMLIRIGGAPTSFSDALAFGYAQQMGASAITNSWGYAIGTPATTNVVNAINAAATMGRGGLGSLVFFAMNNPSVNDCTGANPDISSIPNVIAVSRSTNRDAFDFSGFGNCMDVLAPTAGLTTVSSGRGTLWITTTDMVGAAGYNNNATSASCPTAAAGPPPANARDYTACFNGTSSAAPLTAGVGGLVLSVNPGLSRLQAQQLLQDTSDKTEDSTGAYSANTGFSSPSTGQATHGWGRINAFEAVRVAAPVAQGGRGGVDLFVRDNRLDWGNTEQPSNTLFEATRGYIGHWDSVDIKLDAPPYETAPTAATFDAFVDQTPSAVAGDINRVYVRVRNRGPVTASIVNVKLHWAQFGTALPALPADFWTAFPSDSTNTSQWHPLNCNTAAPAPLPGTVCQTSNLAYSGGSVAATAGDVAQIVQFDFPAPAVDPMLANHFCLLAMIDSPQDGISANSRATFVVDDITPTDNNVTHRNYSNLDTSRSRSFRNAFMVRNPLRIPIDVVLRARVPRGWNFEISPFSLDRSFRLQPQQETMVTMQVTTNREGETADVVLTQELVAPEPKGRVMGGLTLSFRPQVIPQPQPPTPSLVTPYLIGTYDLRASTRTLLHLLNPTGQDLRILVAFFDDNEKPLKCRRDRLSPNDLLEIDVHRERLNAAFGVVKVVAFDAQGRIPQIGIVGNQRMVYKGGSVSETPLHRISEDILRGDLHYIMRACR